MSIPAPTYTYKGLTYEVEDDLYLGFQFTDRTTGLNVVLGAAKSYEFDYGNDYAGTYGLNGEQFGNKGFSYQIDDNDPVFVQRPTEQPTYYGPIPFTDPREQPTEVHINIPSGDIPSSGVVNIRLWASDEDHKPTCRLSHVSVYSGTPNLTDVKIPVTEDLLKLFINAVVDVPDLRRARKLTDVSLSQVTNTELSFNGLTKLRKLSVNNTANLTSLVVDDLDELILVDCNSNTGLQSLSISGCYNLSALNVIGNFALTSIRLIDFHSRIGYVPYPAFYLSRVLVTSNALDAAALNQMYTDLADVTEFRDTNVDTPGWVNPYGVFTSGIINVGNNIGTSSDDPSIATAKNWIVLGT